MTESDAALRYAGVAPLDFPSARAAVGAEEEFLCLPASPQFRAPFGETFIIPARSRDDAHGRLERYLALDTPLGGLMTHAAPPIADGFKRARDAYQDGLNAMQKDWIAGGGVYDETWKIRMQALRNELRKDVRKASPIAAYEYFLFDKARATKELLSPKKNTYPSGITKATGDEVFDTIRSSLKSNAQVDKLVRVGPKFARALTTISVAVSAVELSTSAARVYASPDQKSEEEALRAFFQQAGSTAGSVAGGVAGSLLCAKITFVTAGAGVVICGVAIGSATYFAGELGLAAGDIAFDLIGPASMKLINEIRSGTQ